MVGELGTVLPYVAQTDRTRRAVGWYVEPAYSEPGCECDYCRAHRIGGDVFAGYHMRDALPALDEWARSHDRAAA